MKLYYSWKQSNYKPLVFPGWAIALIILAGLLITCYIDGTNVQAGLLH
jgi:hypothetical protein